MKKLLYALLFVSAFTNAGNPSIIFKENKGQWPEKVLFGADIFNTQFYINKNSFNYCVYSYADLAKTHDHLHHRFEEGSNEIIHGHNYEVNFMGAALTSVTKTKEQPEYYNYFLGNNKSKWASSVKAYGNLVFNDIYEGIDLKVYSSNNLKYDLILKPNANINSLKLNYKHIDGIEIINNELIIKTSVGNVIEREPFAYQNINGKQKQVKCEYTLLSNNTVGFTFPEGYNKNYELVIDPTVIVCSYSGSTAQSGASACTYDANGNIYSFGYALLGYPTTTGAFQVSMNGYYDYVVTAYNSIGSTKTFATYLGGDSLDIPLTIIVKNNEITLFGQTISTDFPCTTSGFDTTYNGNYDFAISKLNITGTSLLASTYIGGSARDGHDNFTGGNFDYFHLGEMVCDTSGNVYILSATTSSNFPVTGSAISSTKNGVSDACVFKMDKTLSNQLWSTYLGGNRDESGNSIKLDGSGGAYLYGVTSSTNFPVTSGAIQSTKLGPLAFGDMFLSHINSTGSSLIASTYLGTTGQDYARLMDLDENNEVYLCGMIANPALIVPTPGIYSNPNGYNTLYKINSSLNSVVYVTKYGNYIPGPFPTTSPYLAVTAFKVDSCKNVYIAGYGEDSFFTTPNAFQSTFGGSQHDLYFAVFGTNCTSLKFASYWGGDNPNWPSTFTDYGEHSDGGINHFDNRGNLYQAICINGGLPTTPGAYASTKPNDSTFWNDAFIKIDFQTFINAGSSYGANITGCPPFTPTFVSTTNTGITYWDLGNGVTSVKDTISTTYTNLGNYNVLLLVTDTNTCNRYDSIKSLVSVINPTEFELEDVSTCLNTKALIQSNVTAVTYSWSTGQTSPNIYAFPGTYTLTINNGGCNSSAEVNVIVTEPKLSERFPNVITPNGDAINDWIDFAKYNFDEVDFYLYDRWGKERYRITFPTEKWQPDDLNNGTYYYVANYKSSCTGKHNTDKGFISVFK
jgi:hypothetical protein